MKYLVSVAVSAEVPVLALYHNSGVSASLITHSAGKKKNIYIVIRAESKPVLHFCVQVALEYQRGSAPPSSARQSRTGLTGQNHSGPPIQTTGRAPSCGLVGASARQSMEKLAGTRGSP